MNEPSVEDRAWGFSQTDFVAALSRVIPRQDAEVEAAGIFDRLRRDPSASVGGDDDLFGLLSLISDRARLQIQSIRRWNADELKEHQQHALQRSWLAEFDGPD